MDRISNSRIGTATIDQAALTRKSNDGVDGETKAAGPLKTGTDTAQISGKATMLSRLFGGRSTDVLPPGGGPSSGYIASYLTQKDRDVVASMYDYASSNGIDPEEVDKVAVDLALYRSHPSNVRSDMPVAAYDTAGNLMPVAFNASDEAAATRILTSKALHDSAVPEDFLKSVLSPVGGHASDFTFLEKFVYSTSKSGSGGEKDPSAVLEPRSPEYFRQLQEKAGVIKTREEVLGAGSNSNNSTEARTFDDRMKEAAKQLSTDQRVTLARLFEMTERLYGSEGPQILEVDKSAWRLAFFGEL